MISKAKWQKYIQKLAGIDQRAGELMRQYIESHGLQDNNALIEYAYALATKYGEASSELACEMYDLMAEAQGAMVPAAVPAETATMEEVAKGMMYGKYHSPSQIPSILSRQVRQAGADTMIQNAVRDRTEWAWIPSGDTCAFCITLASRGWQTASKKVLKGNHAEHIHANCDCTFGIAFNEKGKRDYDSIYDPQKYADMYYGADGRTPTDKINSIRRMKYQQNKDYINAQKRDVYQAKQMEFGGNTDHIKKRQKKDERNISDKAIDHVIKHPLNNPEKTIMYDEHGNPSVLYIGEKLVVVVNPDTGARITVRRPSKYEREKWIKKRGVHVQSSQLHDGA